MYNNMRIVGLKIEYIIKSFKLDKKIIINYNS